MFKYITSTKIICSQKFTNW
uniref:Uncharacterized protein n=1 Tax=Anguilla anguilla TaxID=7936 RepID=A0A0E9U8I7_ANGAN